MKQQQLATVCYFSLVCCLTTVVLSESRPPKDVKAEEINDLDTIHNIALGLIHEDINITLEDHQIRFVKRDNQNVQLDIYHFFIDNGMTLSITLEKILDASYKPKVVSNIDLSDDNAQKLLLSLIGGGNIKMASFKRA